MDEFSLGQWFWRLVQPPHMPIFVLLLGLLLQIRASHKRAFVGRFLTAFAAGVLLAFVLLPIGSWLIRPLENHFPIPEKLTNVHGIIVLGGGENEIVTAARGQPTVGFAASRLFTFMTLARQYPEAKLLYAGGSSHPTRDTTLTQADVARAVMAGAGFSAARVSYESQSRSTYENALGLSAKISAVERAQPWLLVTSAYHLPRAVNVFRAQGWTVIPYPADYLTTGDVGSLLNLNFMRNMGFAHAAVHEYLGLLAYRLSGKVDRLWPSLR